MSASLFPKLLRQRGFTLVELLVAITVLSLMLVALATAMGGVTAIWRAGLGSVDNFNKARVVLNLLDRDIQMMVLRRDVGAFIDGSGNALDGSGNAICAFYTNVPGNQASVSTSFTNDTRAISLVQYTLASSSSSSVLQRNSYGLNFPPNSGTVPAPLTMTIGTTASLGNLSNSIMQTETLFSGIIRFQLQFVAGDGSIKNPANSPSQPFTYNFGYPGASTNYRTVIVSMVVLSNPAYTIATQSGTLSAVTNEFKNTTPSTNQTFSQVWNSLLATPDSGFLALPLPVRSGIQVFERHIPLPITTPSS